jgi:TolB protein
VAFVSDWAGDDDIYLLDPSSGALLNLTGKDQASEERDPVFAADGRALLYRANAGEGWVTYRLDLATGNRALLPGSVGEGAYRGRLALDPSGSGAYVCESYRTGGDGDPGYLALDLVDPQGKAQHLTSSNAVKDANNATTTSQDDAIQRTRGLPGRSSEPESGAVDYDPAWRPGTSEVVYASWRDGRRSLYAIDLDGGAPRPLDTTGQADSPAWHPDGERLAFVRWAEPGADGRRDADLYALEVTTGELTRLTDDPYPDLSPTYGPDGTLYWVRYAPGAPFEVHDPYRLGRWALWMHPAGQEERPIDLPLSGASARTPAAGLALWPPSGVGQRPLSPTPAPSPTATGGLVPLDVDVAGKGRQISARVAASYAAWRQEILAQSGYDFLGRVSDVYRPLGYSGRDYGHLSWHRTGRAVDTLFEWHDPTDGPNLLVVVREDLGANTYWRLYLRTREQDGSMGEPLSQPRWAFWFELDPDREPAAYAAGGRPGAIPPGFYLDLTYLARRHGWARIASYEEDDFDWRSDSVGREFWHYQRTDGLTWWEAMRELYPQETLEGFYSWQICTETLGMDPTWLRAKGIPEEVEP